MSGGARGSGRGALVPAAITGGRGGRAGSGRRRRSRSGAERWLRPGRLARVSYGARGTVAAGTLLTLSQWVDR